MTKRKFLITALLVATILCLISFGIGIANGEYQPHSYLQWQDEHGDVWQQTTFTFSKVTIPENNKTCFIYDGHYSGGIYCFDGVE